MELVSDEFKAGGCSLGLGKIKLRVECLGFGGWGSGTQEVISSCLRISYSIRVHSACVLGHFYLGLGL